jgi:hypothetical protein
MNHLTELLERLQHAEKQYKEADSSLDYSPLELVVAREELKQARFLYGQECMKAITDLLDKTEPMSESKLISWYWEKLA